MAKKRDYQAEYKRRIARGKARGLSKAQARGHAKPNEQPIKPKLVTVDPKLEDALRIMRRTGKQNVAAKQAGVSAERLRRFLYQNSLATRKGRRWTFTDNRKRLMLVLSGGQSRQHIFDDFEQLALNGRHLAAVKLFIDTNDPSYLDDFIGLSVRDARGKTYLLETDRDELYRLAASRGEVFEDVYRLVTP